MIPIISTFNHKGGVAKTSLSVNLVCLAAHDGKSVLLVDADMQGTASRSLGIATDGPGLCEVLHGDAGLSDCLLEAPGHKGLWVLPPGLDLTHLGRSEREDEALEPNQVAATEYASRLVSEIHNASAFMGTPLAFTLVDLPPSYSTVTDMALLASLRILVPMTPAQESVDAIAALLAEIDRKRQFNAGLEILGVVVTMYQRNADQEVYIRKFREAFPTETPFFDTIIPRNQAVSTATSFQKPVVEYDKQGRGAAAYRRLYKEFWARVEVESVHAA
jgi:chromosome partitioning protein